jgi:hypothetical protein
MTTASRRSSMNTVRSLLAALLLVGAAGAQMTLHVVDDDGGVGVDFTSLGAAVAAAADGDMLLVRDGTYSDALLLDGKGLLIAAEAGATVSVEFASVDVINLAANQHAIFRGIDTIACQWTLTDNAGTVWIEDCELVFGLWDTEATVVAQDCANVAIIDSGILGMGVVTVFVADWAASDAVWASGTELSVSGSELWGGQGNGSPYGADVDGGDGLTAIGGKTFITDSNLQGGDGDDETGGTGLVLGPGAQSWLLDTTLVAGLGLFAGQQMVVADTPPTLLTGTAPRISIASPLRYGEPVTVDVTAEPGATVFLLKQITPYGLFTPQFGGVLLIDIGIAHTAVLGMVPASGVLSLNALVPALPLFTALPLANQIAVVAPGGGVSLGNGTHILLLNPADVPAP